MVPVREARKKAILEVLSHYIDAVKFDQIAERWEKQFADQPQFGMAQFLKELYESHAMPISKGDLVSEFNIGLQIVNEEYKANQNIGNAEELPISAVAKAQVTIFSAMYQAFVTAFDNSSRITLINQLSDTVRAFSPRVDANQQKTIVNWLKAGGTLQCGEIDFDILKKIFNDTYFFACQTFGPVKADRFLSVALNEAASLPAANEVAPIELISS